MFYPISINQVLWHIETVIPKKNMLSDYYKSLLESHTHNRACPAIHHDRDGASRSENHFSRLPFNRDGFFMREKAVKPARNDLLK